MNSLNRTTNSLTTAAVETATGLRNLYFTRAGFSIVWVILIALFSKSSATAAAILLTIYPLWDLIATFFDINVNKAAPSKTPQLVNAAISLLTAIAVVFALQQGVPQALIVFGVWAILTGLIQLILGLRRRSLGGQWPMIISGGQSMIGGTSFILLAHDPTMGITSLAGYAAFGAFYFLLAAWRLSKVAATPIVAEA